MALALAASFILAACSSSEPEPRPDENATISGRAVVIDGDTIDIGATRVRLEGIDAPERSQTCMRADGRDWACGRAATQGLTKFIAGHHVSCTSQGTDKYGRTLGLCQVGDTSINQAMIKSGMAWAFVKYSTRYLADEADAQAAHLGVWQGHSEAPWDYRSKRWQSAEVKSPDGCAIKGNVSAKGRIYHMPWNPWYSKVTINAAQGERWFCSEAEAQSAGWRAANGA